MLSVKVKDTIKGLAAKGAFLLPWLILFFFFFSGLPHYIPYHLRIFHMDILEVYIYSSTATGQKGKT